MSGLDIHIISEITRNLRDRYDSGFPVLKELVQNANDARAKNFIFGHHPGFGKTHKHPLITGPALWFFNDGNFEVKDIENITSYGINSKAGDASTIGKFGLGMKSVFHLAEAFLYLGKPHNENYCHEIINPWDNRKPEHPHSDWNHVEEADWKVLEDLANQQLTVHDSQSGFFLWLPLRTEALLAGKGPIISRYPGDPKSNELAFLEESDLAPKLAAVLAMLPHLQRITYHRASGGFNLSVITKSNQSRLTLASDDVVSTEPVYIVEGSVKQLCIAAKHFPAIDNDAYFTNLKNSNAWPKSYFRNSECKEELAPDKSRQEGAVVISHIDGTSGKLQVEWAVFLPLESHAIEVAIPQSSRHYRITLHGQFFVDAGRKGIFGFEDWFAYKTASSDGFDESSLRRNWNKALAERVVLPLLLPALEHYCQAWKLSDDDIESLTNAIGEWIKKISPNKETSDHLRKQVCKPGSWVKELTGKMTVWTVKSDTTRLLPIPRPPKSDKSRPWQIFPALEKLGCAIDSNASFIAQDNILQWGEQETLSCLESIKVIESFTQKGLDYLADWLEMGVRNLPYLKSQSIQAALVKRIREGLQYHGLTKVRGFVKSLTRVLKLLESDKCIGLGPIDKTASSAINETVFKTLWEVECDQLLVPHDLLGEKTISKPIDTNLIAWLKILQPLTTQDEHANSAMTAAQNLLDLLDSENRKNILSSHKDLRVIRTKNVRIGKDVSLSYNELHAVYKSHSLFSASSASTSGSQPLKLLIEALPEQPIFQLTKELKEAVFDLKEKLPTPDDSSAILACVLNSDSPIGHQDIRRKLIAALNINALINHSDEMSHDAQLSLRYLVHGMKEHRFSNEPLWRRDDGTHVIWQKLWSTLVQTPKWQIVDASFVAYFAQNIEKKLRIRKIDPAAVIDQIETDSSVFGRLHGQDFSNEEQEEILCRVKNEELWKKLPLHQFTNGDCGCIEPNVYRVGSIKLPPGLSTQAKFIVISNKKELETSQKEWIPELLHDQIAELVLKSDNPCPYWKFVLDAIAKPESELSDHIDLIHKSVWIPLANGCAIAPNSILHVEGINDEISRLTSATENVFATLDKLNNDFKNHPAFEKFKNEILPRGETAFKIILNAIDMVPSYSVGVFPDGQSALIKEALPELINITKLPGWALISKAAEQLNLAVEDVLAGQKMKPLNTDDLVEILNELAQSEPPKNSLRYKAHLLHLYSLTIDSDCNNQHIKKLILLAKSGNWKPAEDLCAGVSGVTALHLIDVEQQQALYARIYISNLAAQDETINTVEDTNFAKLEDIHAEKIAHEYFGKLESRAKGSAIGCLLSVMGDLYRDLAQFYLKNKFTVDSIRKNLAGNELEKSQSSLVLLDSLNTVKIVISQVLHAKIETQNLLGNLTSFPIETIPETLLIGTPNWVRIKDRIALKVQFVSTEALKQLSNKEINILLKRTTQILMGKIHHDKLDHVDALWKEIDKSDQLDIEIVRHKILESLPSYLAQLGAHRQPPIKDYHVRYKKVHETYITAVTRKDTLAINRADEQRLKHASLLGNCISENKQAHQIILDQVRKKIQGFDYAPDAVLFELFQNADDAAVELARCEAAGDDDFKIPLPSQRLVIYKDSSTIRLMHWGRLINYRPPNLPDKWDGFGDDLIKMLVLNSSDKPDDNTVTGRFGLGFKSVFLVCDKPRIISGDLMVEICGSILPVPWKTANKANDLLHKYTKDRIYRGTLIELDISQGGMNEINQRFEQNIGLLTVFSRAIRQIQIDSDGTSNNILWQPNVVSDRLGIEVGEVRLPGVKSVLTKLLLVRGTCRIHEPR